MTTTCWKCGGAVRIENMGPAASPKFFGLCFGACAGSAKFGSPLTNGHGSEDTARAELEFEAKEAARHKARTGHG